MQIMADVHTHTVFSHGKGTIEQNVIAAMEKGLKVIGIADHGPGHPAYGVRRPKVPAMRREVDRLNRLYHREIRVILGIEANLISRSGRLDVPESILPAFDFVLCGFHRGALPYGIRDAGRLWLRNAFHPDEDTVQDNTQAYLNALEQYRIAALCHLGEYIPVDMALIAPAAQAKGTLIEINNRHAKPETAQLKEALSAGAQFILSSDAHEADAVGGFERAMALCRQAGVPEGRIVNAAGFAGRRPAWLE